MWAFRLFQNWKTWRNSIYNPAKAGTSAIGDVLISETDVLNITDQELDDVLSQFVAEVRKETGERYPGKTLHEIVSSLQKYLEIKGRKVNLFSGLLFQKLMKSLDIEMKISTQDKLGLKPKQAQIITQEIENVLWDNNFLGESCPESLLRTTFYLIGLNFGMRAGDEHRKLSIDSFSFEIDSEGREYLLYSESVSKTMQGGLKHRKLTPRVCRAYANVSCPKRCIVRILKTYIKRCPTQALEKAFYLKPLKKYSNREFWYCSVPLGHNKLQNVIKSMMTEAGIEGYWTNHSLRATAVTRLFQENVDDKLIKGLTGHRSEALQGYKRESDDQLAKVSNIVQGQAVQKLDNKKKNNTELPLSANTDLQVSGKNSETSTISLNISGINCNITVYNK